MAGLEKPSKGAEKILLAQIKQEFAAPAEAIEQYIQRVEDLRIQYDSAREEVETTTETRREEYQRTLEEKPEELISEIENKFGFKYVE